MTSARPRHALRSPGGGDEAIVQHQRARPHPHSRLGRFAQCSASAASNGGECSCLRARPASLDATSSGCP
ncbi:hypothetical protein T492DRAFT_960450 [Pavlovales sp. CCMP2436]|nr:hypothetical protein T492DRAFT_960450 [Pavlovales sp. CCMP2436]